MVEIFATGKHAFAARENLYRRPFFAIAVIVRG
jgi:hypothetical protein